MTSKTIEEIETYLTRLETWEMKYQQREYVALRELCWDLISRYRALEARKTR